MNLENLRSTRIWYVYVCMVDECGKHIFQTARGRQSILTANRRVAPLLTRIKSGSAGWVSKRWQSISKLNHFAFLRPFCIWHHKTAAHGCIDTNRNFSLSSGMSCHILLHIVTTIPGHVDELLKQFWIVCHPKQEHTEILRVLFSWIHCCRSHGTKKTVPGHWEKEKLQLQNLRTVEPKLWWQRSKPFSYTTSTSTSLVFLTRQIEKKNRLGNLDIFGQRNWILCYFLRNSPAKRQVHLAGTKWQPMLASSRDKRKLLRPCFCNAHSLVPCWNIRANRC